MALSRKSYIMDMTEGSIFPKIVKFTLPIMFSGILQLLFNAIDMVVVGQFVGSDALAAVGSNGPLINLIVNFLMGLSVGTNVMVARYYGSKELVKLSDTIHTSILISLMGGVFLLMVGIFFSKPILVIMGTPTDILDQASLYMKIFFIGMPVNMFFNFGAAILRSIGDTRRPLLFLIIAGVTNVVLNLIFVIILKMGVAGVALATIISQAISATLIGFCLVRTTEIYGVTIKQLRIVPARLAEIAKIGLPAGLQGTMFSISNVLIQSSINSFGAIAMAGNAAAGNIEGFAYTSVNSFHQTSVCFIGQNMGAKRYDRVKTIAKYCIFLAVGTAIIIGTTMFIFSKPLLSIYVNDPETIAIGMNRMMFICLPYFGLALMDVMAGVLRGMGYAITPVIVSLSGVCIFRVLWIVTIFQQIRTLDILMLSYPVSWIFTASVHLITFAIGIKKLQKLNSNQLGK